MAIMAPTMATTVQTIIIQVPGGPACMVTAITIMVFTIMGDSVIISVGPALGAIMALWVAFTAELTEAEATEAAAVMAGVALADEASF